MRLLLTVVLIALYTLGFSREWTETFTFNGKGPEIVNGYWTENGIKASLVTLYSPYSKQEDICDFSMNSGMLLMFNGQLEMDISHFGEQVRRIEIDILDHSGYNQSNAYLMGEKGIISTASNKRANDYSTICLSNIFRLDAKKLVFASKMGAILEVRFIMSDDIEDLLPETEEADKTSETRQEPIVFEQKEVDEPLYGPQVNVKIYPNPFRETATISVTSEEVVNRIEILDLNGTPIEIIRNIVDNKATINGSMYHEGTYFIRINENHKCISKFIIQ